MLKRTGLCGALSFLGTAARGKLSIRGASLNSILGTRPEINVQRHRHAVISRFRDVGLTGGGSQLIARMLVVWGRGFYWSLHRS